VESEQCSSAQLSKQRKNELSHRGQALAMLVQRLKEQLG
jgi:XTP/dITP diphosphohydrolase